MNKNKLYFHLLGSLLSYNTYAINTNNQIVELNQVEVVATKTTMTKNSSNESSITLSSDKTRLEENGNIIAPLTASGPIDNIHTTQQQLNNLPGISILGSPQSVSQNISIGGLTDTNIYVGVDGVNNYFASFGHGHGDNQARLLPDAFLFKQVSATQTGADITAGSGNLGGAVNFITLDPEDLLMGSKLSVKASGGLTSVTNGQTANLGFAAQTGLVSYLIAGTFNNNDTQLANGTTLAYSANTNYQNLAKVKVAISKSQEVKISFLQLQNQGLYPAVVNAPTSDYNPTSNFALRQSQLTTDYRYNPDNPYIDFKAKVYYLNNFYQSLPTLTSVEALPQQINIDTGGVKLQNQTNVAYQKFLYGLEYTSINGGDSYNTGSLMNFPSANQQLSGLFIQDSWDIIKQINLTAGTRYNGYSSNSGSYNNSGNLFTNQLALNYNFLKDWNGYVAYTQGFAAPTIQNLYLGGFHPAEQGQTTPMIMLPNPNLKPQLGNNKTIGVKYNHQFAPKHSILASINAYLNDVDNYILQSYISSTAQTTTVQNVNISNAQLYGYTLALNYSMPYFGIDTNFTQGYGQTISAYTNGHGDSIPAGTPLPIPQAKGYVGFNFPIRPIDSIVKLNFNYALDQYQVLPETPNVGGYLLTGLNYTWKPKNYLKGLNVITWVDNLFNQIYQQYDGVNSYIGLARNLYLQGSYRYWSYDMHQLIYAGKVLGGLKILKNKLN